MKLNFWQWLGIILLVIGAIGYALFKDGDKQPAPTSPPADVQPPPLTPDTPLPATQPVP